MKNFNLAVIGAGPAGYTAALEAASFGKSVVCIERDKVGGTCLNRGCIPTKTIIESALCFQKIAKATDFGIDVGAAAVDYPKVLARANSAIERLSKGVEFLLKKANVEYVCGSAKVCADNVIEVKTDSEILQISADKILIATGAKQKKNPEILKAGERILTSTEALMLAKIPESAIVLGAGAIGLEFAWIWNAFGCKVTLVEFEKNILPSANPEVSKNLERALKKHGVQIKTGCCAKRANADAHSVSVEIADANGNLETLTAEYVLWACGMEADCANLFAPEIMPDTHANGFLKIDKRFQTSRANIYAAGDIVGAPMLAHAAITEARCAVDAMFGAGNLAKGAIPACVYTSPQVACVGVSEDGADLLATKIAYMANGKAVAANKTEGFLKIVYDKNSGVIKGAHIMGEDASELISNFVIAVDKNLTCKELAAMTFPHPTLGELITDTLKVLPCTK